MKRLIAFLVLFFMISVRVSANGAPYFQFPIPGYQAVPLKSESIEVLREDLTIDTNIYHYQREFIPKLALITARYQLKNVSDSKVEYSIAFPYINAYLNTEENGKYLVKTVKFNNQDVAFKSKVIPALNANTPNYPSDMSSLSFDTIISSVNDAIDEDTYETGESAIFDSQVRILLFEITLEPYQLYEMEVSFYQEASINGSPASGTDYLYSYLLEPAKYWKSFRDLNIEIIVPKGYKAEDRSIPFEKSEDGRTFRAYFKELPEHNLELNIYKPLNSFEKFLAKLQPLIWFFGPWTIIILLAFLTIICFILIYIIKKTYHRLKIRK